MLLDEQKRFIFISVPRTGCRSVHNWFKENLDPSPISMRGGFHRTRPPKGRKYEPRRGWLYVAGIRHPLDRLVSFFYVPELRHDIITNERIVQMELGRQFLEDQSFDNFVRLVAERHPESKHFNYTWAACPVAKFLSRVEYPMTNLLRFETLEQDIRVLPFVKGAVRLDPVGTSERRPLVDYYRNDETLQLALDWGRLDFEKFAYEPSLEAACALRGELC